MLGLGLAWLSVAAVEANFCDNQLGMPMPRLGAEVWLDAVSAACLVSALLVMTDSASEEGELEVVDEVGSEDGVEVGVGSG